MDVVTKCKDCNKPFTITEGNQKWFKDQGFELPKRCAECRAKRKMDRIMKAKESDNGK